MELDAIILQLAQTLAQNSVEHNHAMRKECPEDFPQGEKLTAQDVVDDVSDYLHDDMISQLLDEVRKHAATLLK